MNVRNIFTRKRERRNAMGKLTFAGTTYSSPMAMKLSAVYRCVDCICSAVAQLPLEIFSIDRDGYKHKELDHPLYMTLNKKPNARMTRGTFITLLLQASLLEGNGYAYIKRNKSGMPEQLLYLLPQYVTIVPPGRLDLPVKYKVTGIEGEVEARDMIHIVNRSYDGVTGISTISFASKTLGLAHDAERHAANFFASGCGIGGILKFSTRLRDEQVEKYKESWKETFGSANGGQNGVAIIDMDADYRPVSVNPSDAQLLQTREFNVVDICRFFGVSPVKAFDLSKSSYSTVEATNISFLTDTISPLLEKIELEFETKLFNNDPRMEVRFDVSQLLRADKQSLANYYSTLFQIGAINPNEIRREIDLPPIDGGDSNFVQVNLQPLDKAAEGNPGGNDTPTTLN